MQWVSRRDPIKTTNIWSKFAFHEKQQISSLEHSSSMPKGSYFHEMCPWTSIVFSSYNTLYSLHQDVTKYI